MASQDSAMENGEDFSKDVTTEIQENKVTRFQSNKNLEKKFEAEVSDDDCVLDSSDDEYFPPSQAAASDCDDTDGEIALNNGDKDQEDEDKESENGEDEDEESEVKATASGMTAKDGTQWAATSPIEHQAGRYNIVRERCGPNRNTNMLSNLDTFKLFFTPEMADIIIRHTNKKAISTYANYNEKNPEKKQLEWKNLELQEFYAFLAILITSGANNSNTDNAREMWQPYSYPLYRAAMSINRFWNIIRFIRFDDANTRAQRLENDKAAPIRDIWTMLNSNLAKHYKPTEYLTIHEQLYPYRGRTRFTQYIPSKPAKYGIKVWWICDAENSYPLTGQLYTGKSKDGREKNVGERVVKDLVAPYRGSGRNITMDNFFTTLPLAKFLLSWNLTIVGTLKKNKAYIPPAMAVSKTREELSTVFGFHEKVTLCSYVPKKNKVVIMLSSMHHEAKISDSAKKKPEIIEFYNRSKAGVDTMDKLLGRYTTKRSTQRWPLAFFYNILDIACLASYILYYENNKMIVKNSYERRLFYRQLGRELCIPFVESRSNNAQIMRHFSTKVAIESLLGRAINPNAHQRTSSVSLTPQTQLDSTGRKKITGVCYECLQSEFKKRRKTRKICLVCENPICQEHCITTTTCEGCTK
ncbi:piggyBac transposable element-derived protein 4 isoform X2 [Rhynchophorus ferrugineus]|uniref:piggyBac transposable element-derived protein 4 isoform X2 n=1 Tax=Rhynchophorus ferrugineus TaxID=354439 RepID=UPI003FCDAB09